MPDWAASIGEFNIAEANASGVPIIVGVQITEDESPHTYLARGRHRDERARRPLRPVPVPDVPLAITPACTAASSIRAT